MRPLVEATVADGSGSVRATFFNQPWLVGRYPPGTRLVLHGSLNSRRRFNVSDHARTGGAPAGNGTVAHYSTTEGLTSAQLLALVRRHADALGDVLEPLPTAVRVAERLPDRPAALAFAHFASGDGAARRRLAFEELLLLQLALLRRRALRRQTSTAPVIDSERALTARWLSEKLPFTLTNEQARALEAIEFLPIDGCHSCSPPERLREGTPE